MTSDGLGEMFEGDSGDTLTRKFPLVSTGGRAEGLACADPVARTPICASGFFFIIFALNNGLMIGDKETKLIFSMNNLPSF